MMVYVNMCEVYEIIGRRGGLEEVDRELEPLKPLADFNLRDSKPLPKLCTRRHPEALEITDLPSAGPPLPLDDSQIKSRDGGVSCLFLV